MIFKDYTKFVEGFYFYFSKKYHSNTSLKNTFKFFLKFSKNIF